MQNYFTQLRDQKSAIAFWQGKAKKNCYQNRYLETFLINLYIKLIGEIALAFLSKPDLCQRLTKYMYNINYEKLKRS